MHTEHIILIASLGSFIGSFLTVICIYRKRFKPKEIDILGNCVVIKMASCSRDGLETMSVATETEGPNNV